MTSWPIPAGLDVVVVNGYPVAYRDVGHGPALVLVHGSFNDCRTWDAQIMSLQSRCRLLAPSLRHYYPEPWSGGDDDFSIDQHAADLAAFIQALHLEDACVMGHSRGGAVALTLARRFPHLVGGLILADPRGLEDLLPRSPEGAATSAELRGLFTDLRHHLNTRGIEHAARSFVDALGGPGAWDRRTPELRQMFLDNIATSIDTGEAPELSCGDVRRLAMPVLLLTGSRSPERYGLMLAAFQGCGVERSRVVVIPDAGHAMHRDNPVAFNATLSAFMSEPAR